MLLAARLGRTPDQVRARRRVLVGARPAGRPYLPDEDEAIGICLTGGGELKILARRLGRTPIGLRLRAQQLGVHRPVPRRRWTDWRTRVACEPSYDLHAILELVDRGCPAELAVIGVRVGSRRPMG